VKIFLSKKQRFSSLKTTFFEKLSLENEKIREIFSEKINFDKKSDDF